MRYALTSTLVLLFLVISSAAVAEEHGHTMNQEAKLGMHAEAEHANIGIGTVNQVDLQNGTVNLTHGPIKTLGWPGMTMDFKVKDKLLLKEIKPGEKVEFNVVKEGPGKFYIDYITI